jgi:hypothetical protein
MGGAAERRAACGKKTHTPEPSFSGKKNKEPEIPCVFPYLGVTWWVVQKDI